MGSVGSVGSRDRMGGESSRGRMGRDELNM